MSTWLVDGGALLATGWHAAQPDRAADTARRAFVHQIFRVLAQHKPTGLGVFFDAPPCPEERKRALCPKWRADRPQKPAAFWGQVIVPLRGMVEALGGHSYLIGACDADDLIATVVARAPEDEEAIILSRAQRVHQLLALPGVRFWDGDRFLSAQQATVEDEIEPGRLVELLALTGSRPDNLPGIQGVGPKTARQLLLGTATLAQLIEKAQDPAWAPLGGVKGQRISADLRSASAAAQLTLNAQIMRLATNAPGVPAWDALALRQRDDGAVKKELRSIGMNKLAAWLDRQEESWGDPPEGDEG
jgi:DNA polymerase-1